MILPSTVYVYLTTVLVQPICPTNTCAHCPKIPKCEAPKTRLLQFGSDLNVLPVPAVDKAVWERPSVGGPPSPDTIDSKPFCPVLARRFYDHSYVQSDIQSSLTRSAF